MPHDLGADWRGLALVCAFVVALILLATGGAVLFAHAAKGPAQCSMELPDEVTHEDP